MGINQLQACYSLRITVQCCEEQMALNSAYLVPHSSMMLEF